MDFQKDMKEKKGIEKNGDKATLLFCKVAKEDTTIKHYFDRDLN